MNVVLIVLHVIVCLVLILVILLQAGRGQGLGGASFGGGNVQSLLGTKTSSFFTKATSVCAILFLFTCIGLTLLEAHKSRSLFAHKAATKTPLDVEQVRKALEKIKKTDAATAAQDEAAETTAVVDEATAAAADTKAETETAAK